MSRLKESGGEPCFESAVLILSERYEDDDTKDIDKAFCIMERMRCLSLVAKDDRMRGWTKDSVDKDCLLRNEAIFRAAASCPVRDEDGKPYFDADEFFSLALNESPSEGNA